MSLPEFFAAVAAFAAFHGGKKEQPPTDAEFWRAVLDTPDRPGSLN